MICFFTSSPTIPGTNTLNPANGFADELLEALPYPCNAVFICSNPDDPALNERYGQETADCFEEQGVSFSDFAILDRRNAEDAAQLVASAQFVILCGGHTPTQNRFFHEIGLKELLQAYDGILMGVSAGSMNSAENVYAHPELEGEAVDPNFTRFLQGLGLTQVSIIPHYQAVKDDILDGLRLFEDIAIPDSMGRQLLVLPDGSYILSVDGQEELRGEAYLIQDGVMEQISSEGDVIPMDD